MAYSAAVEQWRPLVAKYFPAELVDKALYVIQGESGGNPSIAGDGGAARGLFQIQDSRNFASRPSAAYLDDPENNIRFAAQQLGAAQGRWSDWGEGSSYNGQPFGALGNNPYPGGGGSSGGAPLGGRASTSAGITFGGATQPRSSIYNNLASGSGNNGRGAPLTQQATSPGFLNRLLGSVGTVAKTLGQYGSDLGGGGGAPPAAAPAAPAEDEVQAIMNQLGVTRDQALEYIGFSVPGLSKTGPDHFFDTSPDGQRDFGESVFRDRRDFGYNAGQDAADRTIIEAEQAAKVEQQKFDNAMAVGDFQAAQQAAERKNHWDQVAATQQSRQLDLTGQGQQLDYNIGLGNIAADRYSTDANLALGNAKLGADTALGQQANQTNQFDAESGRLKIAQDYQIGMANATTDAERVAVEERRRQDTVAIANMESQINLTLGQQNNTNTAFANDTDRMRSMQSYYASLAGVANEGARIGIDDASRIDKNSQFNAGEQNAMTLGQQSNRTNQFGAETDRANRMGQLALEQNKFILDAAGQPRNMFSLYMMQRGLAPDWETLGNGGQVAQGAALAPVDVMNAYTPVTTPGTFNAVAAQSQASSSGVQPGANPMDSNWFLKNFANANTATTAVPQFNEQFRGAQGAAASNYDSSQNRFIGADPGYRPTTGAPSFNYTPERAQPGAWTGPGAVNNFLPAGGAVPAAPKSYSDTNIGGLGGGVPIAGLRPGLNLSTVGGPDITGAEFGPTPAYYDQGMTQRIGAGDRVQGGSQVWTWYGGGQPQPPAPGAPGLGMQVQRPSPDAYPQVNIPGVQRMATGGLTRAPQFITGDDPRQPGGLGENAELNEPIVDPGGIYKGTRITPLNPARRPLGNAWGGDNLAMAAGFGLRPHTVFSQR